MKTIIYFPIILCLFYTKLVYSQFNLAVNQYTIDTVFSNKRYAIKLNNTDHIWSNSEKHNGIYFFKSDSLDLRLFVMYTSRHKKFLNNKISKKLSNDEYRSRVCSLIMEYYTNAEQNKFEEYILIYDAQSHVLSEKIKSLTSNNRMIYKFNLFLNDGTICHLMFHCSEGQMKWVEDYLKMNIEIIN